MAMLMTLIALAEPNRLRMVELLREGPETVGVISARLDIRQPQVSKHLKVLKEVGLVDVAAQGQQRVYALQAAPLQEIHHWLERYRVLWEARFESLDGLLDELQKEDP